MSADNPTIDALSDETVFLRVWAPSSVIFLAAGLYAVFSAFFPEVLRASIAGAISLYLIVCACLPRFFGRKVEIQWHSIVIIMMIFFIIVNNYVVIPVRHEPFEIASEIFRSLTAVSALVYFMCSAAPVLPRAKIIVYVSALAAAVALTAQHGLYEYGGSLRPYPFHYGEDAVHPSAYVILAAFLGVVVMRMQREIGRSLAWLLGLPLFALVIAYQVRTTWLMLLVFFGVQAGARLYRSANRHTVAAAFGMVFAGVLLATPVLLLLVLPEIDFTRFSSGRTATYIERLDIVAERSIGTLMLGTGLGSDSFFSSSWWWERKDSHNDFLHILVEQGVIGLALFLAVIASTIRNASAIKLGIILSVVTAAAISNGLLDRPMPAVMYFGMAALAMSSRTPAARSQGAIPHAGAT